MLIYLLFLFHYIIMHFLMQTSINRSEIIWKMGMIVLIKVKIIEM